MSNSTTISQPTEYEDTPVRWMIYPSLLFMLVAMFIGVFMSYNTFVFPDYFAGEYIHFGKIRPGHVGGVTLLWLLSADIGLLYYMTQRLCGVPLWSPLMAKVSCILWWFSLLLMVFSYPMGTNYGWEYAELPMWIWWIPTKPIMTLAWILVVINLYATLAIRKFQQMYVSLLYIMWTLLWTTVTFLVGAFSLELLPFGISRVNASFFMSTTS